MQSRPARTLRTRNAHLELGRLGEAAAAEYLCRAGYRIIARDWRCRLGQIDLVALAEGVVVVVEVKARRGRAHGLPQEAVDVRKQEKLRRLTDAFRIATGRTAAPVRIDVVAVSVDAGGEVCEINHLENVVGG